MLKKLFLLISRNPLIIPVLLRNKLFILWVSLKQNIVIEGRLNIHGLPLIDIRKGSKLQIGNGVTLNSNNKGYI